MSDDNVLPPAWRSMRDDEGALRYRYPEIPWDQPVSLSIIGMENLSAWACRYCIALHGIKAQDVIHGKGPEMTFASRDDALAHIESAHHD